MKVYKVSPEILDKYKSYITNNIRYGHKDLIKLKINHAIFQCDPVITEQDFIKLGFEELDNKHLMDFINNMEKLHEIHS